MRRALDAFEGAVMTLEPSDIEDTAEGPPLTADEARAVLEGRR